MNQNNPHDDEREILLRAIDLLSMEVLRLKSENEVLRTGAGNPQKKKITRPRHQSVWTKAVNYYHREGLVNTIKKIISKFIPG